MAAQSKTTVPRLPYSEGGPCDYIQTNGMLPTMMCPASDCVLKRKRWDLNFPFPLPAAGNADVIAGSGAAILDHEEEDTG